MHVRLRRGSGLPPHEKHHHGHHALTIAQSGAEGTDTGAVIPSTAMDTLQTLQESIAAKKVRLDALRPVSHHKATLLR